MYPFTHLGHISVCYIQALQIVQGTKPWVFSHVWYTQGTQSLFKKCIQLHVTVPPWSLPLLQEGLMHCLRQFLTLWSIIAKYKNTPNKAQHILDISFSNNNPMFQPKEEESVWLTISLAPWPPLALLCAIFGGVYYLSAPCEKRICHT